MDGILIRAFGIDVERDGVAAVVRPVGEIDIGTGPQVEERVATLVAAGVCDLSLDLSRVSFLDSAGLQMIITTRAELRRAGGAFRLVAASPSVVRFLAMTGMEGVLGHDLP